MLECGCMPTYEGGYGDDGKSGRYSMEWCPLHAAAAEMRDLIADKVSGRPDKLWNDRARALLAKTTALHLSEPVRGNATMAKATDSIRPTRFEELGYRNDGRGLWRIYDMSSECAVGPHYASKMELLADLARYARDFGCKEAPHA